MRNVFKRIYALLPRQRRVSIKGKGVWRLALRKILYPWFQYPVSITVHKDIRLIIGTNRMDERMLTHMLGTEKHVYFPPLEIPAQPSFTVLDIGGHHGFYSMLALGEYSTANVICVEPSKESVEIIKKHALLNHCLGRIEIVNAALGARNDTAYLKIENLSWSNSIVENMDPDDRLEETRTVTLETILKSNNPYIVKCNAEGAEYYLVQQLHAMNLRPKLIILMIHPDKTPNSFGSADIIERITNMGYRAENVRPGSLRPVWHFHLETQI